MDTNFITTIEDNLKIPLFTDNDLMLIFRNRPPSAIYNLVSYHLRKKHLVRYRRGLYSLARKKNEKLSFTKFKLANKLVLHSFISFESALSHHGLIPEAVYEITSVCLTKNKIFKNSLGQFSFTYSPVRPFYLGVEFDAITKSKIANPVRALFDLICLRRKLYTNIKDLESDLRIDLQELSKYLARFEASEILQLGELYKKNTTRNLATILERDLK